MNKNEEKKKGAGEEVTCGTFCSVTLERKPIWLLKLSSTVCINVKDAQVNTCMCIQQKKTRYLRCYIVFISVKLVIISSPENEINS